MRTFQKPVTQWIRVARNKLGLGPRGWFIFLFILIDGMFTMILLLQLQNTQLTIVYRELAFTATVVSEKNVIFQIESQELRARMTSSAITQTRTAMASPTGTSSPTSAVTPTPMLPSLTATLIPPSSTSTAVPPTPTRTPIPSTFTPTSTSEPPVLPPTRPWVPPPPTRQSGSGNLARGSQ